MDQHVRDIWTEALESGEYKQGKGSLRNEESKYCCLGVLCDLYHKETGLGKWVFVEGDPNFRFVINDKNGDNSAAFLPDSVKKWAGIEYARATIPGRTVSLAGLNDTGSSFAEIAKIIKEEL